MPCSLQSEILIVVVRVSPPVPDVVTYDTPFTVRGCPRSWDPPLGTAEVVVSFQAMPPRKVEFLKSRPRLDLVNKLIYFLEPS